MANMSYCRFRNTYLDFSDCVGALEDMIATSECNLDCVEKIAADRLCDLCREYIEYYEQLKEDGTL